jgi:formylglycine-generating enzyme required for sulfatase activity
MQERGINTNELEPARLRSAFTIGGMDFVLVPAGKFIMGIRDDNTDARDGKKTQHTVQLPDYYIGRFPVTNLQFNEFIKESQIQHEWIQNWQEKLAHPVVNITWRDAMAFCQWLHGKYRDELPAGMSLTLPSEAEWEKAARGEFGKNYPWGDQFDKALCNTWEGGKHSTTPVGAYSPEGDSPYGVVDMAGNVWEWCHSLYKPYPYQVGDGREDEESPGIRIMRGGSWGLSDEFARGDNRNWDDPHYKDKFIGFRCALTPRR